MRRYSWIVCLSAVSVWVHVAATPSHAQFSAKQGLADPFGGGLNDALVTASAKATFERGSRSGMLSVTAEIAEGWHIFSITQASGGPVATQIKLKKSSQYRVIGDFRPSSEPITHFNQTAYGDLPLQEHERRVTWTAAIELADGVGAEQLEIYGSVFAQACAKQCEFPRDYPFKAITIVGATPTDESIAAPSSVPSAIGIGADTSRNYRGRGSVAERNPAARFNPDEFKLAEAGGGSSLIAMMGVGFLGGLILNLMPCVLPVIGLKILSFVEQSGHSRRQAFFLNVWYSLGILAVFMVLATLPVVSQLWFKRQFGWGEQFSFVGFNIALSAVVFVMALSFLGVWEIPIPGFIGTGTTQELAAREGFWGALAKGAVTTVLATPCSGPFLGTALAFALVQPPLVIYLMFACIGLGMSSPYLLFGAFPRLLRWLPRPGAWMETFKQVMGFVLLGTVVYLLTLVESEYVIPALTLCFGLWAGCWWIGRTPVYAPWVSKARAWAVGLAVPTMIGTLGFYWLGPQPASALAWRPFSMQELTDLTADQKTVMVDFTANWCPTCKLLDRTVLNTAATKRYIEENGIVPMFADLSKYPPEERELLAKLGARFIPVVAIFPAGRPNEPIVLRDTYTRNLLLQKLKEAGPSKSSGLAALAVNPHER